MKARVIKKLSKSLTLEMPQIQLLFSHMNYPCYRNSPNTHFIHRTPFIISYSVESYVSSAQFRSVAQLCLTLCNPMDCSTPVFPVLHHLPELAQTFVHWVSDAIQPSHPLFVVPFFSCPNLSHHQGLFPVNWLLLGGQSIGASASVLSMNIQGWFTLRLTGLITLLFKRLSRVLSSTKVWRHQFSGIQPFFIFQLLHPYMTTGKKYNSDSMDPCRQSNVSAF